MISDLAVAHLIFNLYEYDGKNPYLWDWYDDGRYDDRICWGIKSIDGVDVIVFRGSVTGIDWVRDFHAWADPFHKTSIGRVHPGFLIGMDRVCSEAVERIGPDVVIAGHSLGAARALVLTALLMHRGMPHGKPPTCVVFGSPKPGFQDFANVLSDVAIRNYCCGDDEGHDLVTEVPFSFPPQEYVHPSPLISVRAIPAVDDLWGPFRYHHMPLYLQALGARHL